mgnify:CR=1 FL=1
MGTIANAKVTHYYNCYNGDFIGCLHRTSNMHVDRSLTACFLITAGQGIK